MFKFLRKIFTSRRKDDVENLKTRVSTLESEIALLKSKKSNIGQTVIVQSPDSIKLGEDDK